jgi:hypothetical protein
VVDGPSREGLTSDAVTTGSCEPGEAAGTSTDAEGPSRTRPNHIKAPASKWPGWRYGDETVSWDVRLPAKELAVLASPHKVLSIEHCSGPPETSSICFPHQRS